MTNAEIQVIAAITIDSDAVAMCGDLSAEDFSTAEGAKIFAAAQTLFANGQPTDAVSLHRQSHCSTDALELVISNATTAKNVRYHASAVLEDSRRRETASLARSVEQMISEGHSSTEAMRSAQSKLDALQAKVNSGGLSALSDGIGPVYSEIAELVRSGGGVPGVETGIGRLDNLLLGLEKQDLIILCARPSMGKTALCMQIAQNVAKSGGTVAYFGLEGSAKSLIHRMIASKSGIDMTLLRTGRLPMSSMSALSDASAQLHSIGKHFYMDVRSSLTPLDIRAEIRALSRKHDVSLVVVDHLGLMNSGEKSQNRNDEVGKISRALKGIAKDMDVPLIALSQLSRAADGSRPSLRHLRDSGSLEQDADVVISIFREEDDEGQKLPAAEIAVIKARNGPLGMVRMVFDGRTVSFREP